MKALVFVGPRDMQYQDVPTPEPKEGEVRIQVKAVSICGSDSGGYKGGSAMRTPGLIMGHEFSGVIEKLGPGVTGLQVGQRVGTVTCLFCETCRDCQDGLGNVCMNRAIIGTTMPKYGPYPGAMADFVIAPAKKIMPLPDHVSFNEAALIEPLSISLRAVKHVKDIAGKTVAVYGAGPIGLLAMQVLRAREAARIIAIDVVDSRLQMAKDCGATHVINSKNDNVAKIIAEMTDEGGVDVVFDAVGAPATVNDGVEIVRCGGTVVWIGLAVPVFEFDYKHAVCKEITFQCSYMYTTEMEEGLELIASGKMDVAKIITGVYPMSEGGKHFELIAKGESKDIKIILTND
ncbi:MAG: zinc-binding dehydrogenase [Planctomycetes bacterium]|nr:zinc-binding dehydrogenase [Planctomycetota bacterium]MCD7898264.1 zinc-binding dehydrogenase [Planctomycetaceae bacterium]